MPVALCLEFYIWGLKFLWMPLRNILRTILNGRIPRLSMKQCFIRIGVWSDGPKDSLFGKMFVDSNQNIVVIIMQELHWSRFMCEELWQAKTVFAWLLFCWVCMQQKYYSGLRNNVGMSNVDTMDTFTFLSLSKHKANITEFHTKVRQTCLIAKADRRPREEKKFYHLFPFFHCEIFISSQRHLQKICWNACNQEQIDFEVYRLLQAD